jgi:GGDEF domain-containing protein
VDVLAKLPSSRTLRARLTREIDLCLKAGRPAVCAVVRLENETAIAAKVGRAVTDALLGGLAAALLEAFPDRLVRGDLDELVVVAAEDQLTKLDAIAADAPQFAAGLGVPATIDVKIRWGARMLDAHRADVDTLIDGARQAVDLASQAGTTSHVDRS